MPMNMALGLAGLNGIWFPIDGHAGPDGGRGGRGWTPARNEAPILASSSARRRRVSDRFRAGRQFSLGASGEQNVVPAGFSTRVSWGQNRARAFSRWQGRPADGKAGRLRRLCSQGIPLYGAVPNGCGPPVYHWYQPTQPKDRGNWCR
ncbi:hypothetical protein BD779DRAFT_1476577 [Infundibulicybe gibba]|nr:hypothetical protein BD779DRAFT_1476577 [Infundibulicybe gibba]